MLSRRTIKIVTHVLRVLCAFNSVPYSATSPRGGFKLTARVSRSHFRLIYDRIVFLTTGIHSVFITIRLIQAYLSHSQKIFILFYHFVWCITFLLLCCLHVNLLISHSSVKVYFNGLLKFFSSTISMPGSRWSGKMWCRFY